MQKLVQIGPMNRGLHCGPHEEPSDTSKRSDTKTVIRYHISKPSCNTMWQWHKQYSYTWSQRKHVHLKHIIVTHDSHKAKAAAVIHRSAEISTLKDRGR